jgi:hypothetical protein
LQLPEQQVPSSHTPVEHDAAPPAHGWPGLALHAPLTSQMLLPPHVSGSCALMTDTQAPVPATHVWQVPPHAPLQHVPSSHTPEVHSTFVVHEPPAATCPMHAPALLQ